MMTQTEVNRLFEQVNKAFEADRARIDTLEKKMKELSALVSSEKAPKPAKGTEK